MPKTPKKILDLEGTVISNLDELFAFCEKNHLDAVSAETTHTNGGVCVCYVHLQDFIMQRISDGANTGIEFDDGEYNSAQFFGELKRAVFNMVDTTDGSCSFDVTMQTGARFTLYVSYDFWK